MIANPDSARQTVSTRRATRFRQAGLLIFIVGLAAGALIGYVDITHPVDSGDNSLTDGYYKSQSAETQKQLGNAGVMMLTLRENIQNGERGIIIAGFSTVAALACFLLAGQAERTR